MHKARAGFSIAELLITVACVATMATVAAPSYLRTVENQRRERAVTTLRVIRQMQEAFHARRNTYTSNWADLRLPAVNTGDFTYAIASATATDFTANATRVGNAGCVLSINAAGTISGCTGNTTPSPDVGGGTGGETGVPGF